MIKNLLVSFLLFFVSSLAVADAVSREAEPRIGKLYWVGGNQLCRANLDGSNFEVLVKDLEAPDGLVVSLPQQTVVWTNMARGPNGSLQRTDLHGKALQGDGKYLVDPGSFETGKEIELDTRDNKLYWADRDGMKVMRANRDGSNVEAFVHHFIDRDEIDSDGKTIALENPVGIALDLENRHLYFTDRFMARVMRVSLDVAPVFVGQKSVRTDVETLFQGDRETSRPIDIDLDLEKGLMYWTDRGEHTISVAKLDGSKRKVIVDNDKIIIKDPIGISLDLASQTFVWTDMTTHKIYRANLDGSNIQTVLEGDKLLNGIPYGPLGIVTKAVEPESGSEHGGQQVFVVGENFVENATQVYLGKTRIENLKVADTNLLSFTAPAGKVGKVDLRIVTPAGETLLPNAYTYRKDDQGRNRLTKIE